MRREPRRLRENCGDGRIERLARSEHRRGGAAVAGQIADERTAGLDEGPRGERRRAGRVERGRSFDIDDGKIGGVFDFDIVGDQ